MDDRTPDQRCRREGEMPNAVQPEVPKVPGTPTPFTLQELQSAIPRLVMTMDVMLQQLQQAANQNAQLTTLMSALLLRQGGQVQIGQKEVDRIPTGIVVEATGAENLDGVVLRAKIPAPTIVVANQVPAGVSRLLQHRNGK